MRFPEEYVFSIMDSLVKPTQLENEVFGVRVYPVRNSSPAIAGLETERGIKPRPTGRNPELF